MKNQLFKTQILKEFKTWCVKQKVPESIDAFIHFALDKQLFKDKAILHTAIRCKYGQVLKQNNGRKNNTVYQLADLFEVHENTVWNALKGN